MRRPLVAGNWKMYGSKTMISGLMSTLKGHLAQFNAVEIALCPPFVYLDYVRQLSQPHLFPWGLRTKQPVGCSEVRTASTGL